MPSNTEQRGKLRDSVRDLERELRVAKALVKFHRSDAGLAKARETHQRRLAGMALGGGHSDPYKLSQIDKIDPEKEREHAARNAENRRAQIEAELRQARADLEREDRRPKWQTTARLEKEAVASKYRASTNQADSGGAEQDEETAASPDVWRRLHDEFRALAHEELTRDPQNKRDRWLRAYFYYAGLSTECGGWSLSEGLDEEFRARFDVEATRAGVALGLTQRRKPLDVWLHHVFAELLARKSKLLLAADKDSGGIILRVCEASAICCAQLEMRELESHNANLTTPVAALASRRQHRPPDARKELIARLKARHQDVLARRICELIDKNINTTPIYKHGLAPLETWLSQAPGSRSWIDVYDHPETHDLVRSYVNKVPRLKTAKSSK